MDLCDQYTPGWSEARALQPSRHIKLKLPKGNTVGLDLYVANSLAEAATSKLFSSLDSQVHASVMRYVSTSDFPLLSKMADYLSDTSYEKAEVSALLDELTNLKMIIHPTSSVHKNIDGLLVLIRKALELRSGLFAVSD